MVKLVFAPPRLPHLSRQQLQRTWREDHARSPLWVAAEHPIVGTEPER